MSPDRKVDGNSHRLMVAWLGSRVATIWSRFRANYFVNVRFEPYSARDSISGAGAEGVAFSAVRCPVPSFQQARRRRPNRVTLAMESHGS